MPFADVQAILQFLKNPATTYATSLPGRLPGHKHKESHMTKRSVYHQYVKACSDDGSHISVGQSLLSG